MRFKIFKNQNIIQGISESKFGSMVATRRTFVLLHPSPRCGSGKRGDKNAIKFLKSLDYKVNIKNLIWAEQVFGCKVHICKEGDLGKIIKGVDGLISNIKNQILAVVSADCVPILLFDPKNRVVAALHGSRNSLVKGIIKKAILKMVLNFQSQPKQILVGIGPHIKKCHYWLREKTHRELKNAYFKKYLLRKKGKTYFDLTKLAFDELLSLGIKRKNIEDCRICTSCQFKKYFSARKKQENPKIYTEKNPIFASFIGLKIPQILESSSKNLNFLIQKAAKSIRKGEVVVSPTDTVYGLVADATNKKAVERLFKIKRRRKGKPIPIFVKDIKIAKKSALIDKNQERFLTKVWPGKTTAVLKRKQGIRLYGVDKKTIALRIPSYRFLNTLLKKINRPLTGTSANISGKPASTEIKEIINQFKNQKHQPDLIIDARNLPKNRPSKVIDLRGRKIKILRE